MRNHRGRVEKINLTACAECESPCTYGMEMLEALDKKAFEALQCGASCEQCRQPCNLRRIAIRRGIQWVSKKEKMQESWLHVAMRPYHERNGGGANV